jgi:pseudouridine-5'-phosphate glycosidase/pseudouridine kinase
MQSLPGSSSATSSSQRLAGSSLALAPSVVIFGSAALDITSQSPIPLVPGTTTPGRINLTPGGVGRNIAEAAQNLLPQGAAQLVSPIRQNEVGELDMVGRVTKLEMQQVGLRTDGLVSVLLGEHGEGSAACTLHLGPGGDLEVGVADMGIVERMTESDVSCRGWGDDADGQIKSALRSTTKPKMVVFDCNLTPDVIRTILLVAANQDIDSQLHQAIHPDGCDQLTL